MHTSAVSSPFTSICATCRLRSFLSAANASRTSYTKTQVRGKKKNARPAGSINVRLIKDLTGYGRKGSIVPMPVGQMRNFFYPRRFAEYVTWTEARDLKKTSFVAHRDWNFGKGLQEQEKRGAEIKSIETSSVEQPARATRRAQAVRVDVEKMEPADALNLLSQTLPEAIHFYRTAVDPNANRSGKTPQPSSQTAGPSKSIYPDQANSIYGSVTVTDVVTNLKALLASNEEAAGRVVLAEDDVRFISGTEDETRVKHLGDFDIEIRVKGVSQTVKRKVRVLPEEQAPVDREAGEQAVRELAAEQPLAGDVPEDLIVQDANVNAKVNEVDEMLRELEASLGEIRASMEESKMTPAEAAEQSPSNVTPDQVDREGIVEEQVELHQAPSSARLDPGKTDVRRR